MTTLAATHDKPNLGRLLAYAKAMRVDLDHFAYRILQDAIVEGTAAHWLRRAEEFGDVGNPQCDQIAQACLNAATFTRYLRDPSAITPPRHNPDTCPWCLGGAA